MSLAKESTKKLLDEIKKNNGRPLNIGIEVGKKNPKIDYYCHNCERQISHYQYEKGKGLCKPCILALDKDPKTGWLRIVKVLPKTPALQADLSTGLIIQKIDETAVADKTLEECVNLIRGAVGTKVRLEVFNPEQNKTNTVELTRR